MQGSSNYPNFYFSRDIKGVVSGCVWPQINEDKMVKGGHSSNGFLSPLSAGLYVGYGREALKQIMLKQEAIFRDQVSSVYNLIMPLNHYGTMYYYLNLVHLCNGLLCWKSDIINIHSFERINSSEILINCPDL